MSTAKMALALVFSFWTAILADHLGADLATVLFVYSISGAAFILGISLIEYLVTGENDD